MSNTSYWWTFICFRHYWMMSILTLIQRVLVVVLMKWGATLRMRVFLRDCWRIQSTSLPWRWWLWTMYLFLLIGDHVVVLLFEFVVDICFSTFYIHPQRFIYFYSWYVPTSCHWFLENWNHYYIKDACPFSFDESETEHSSLHWKPEQLHSEDYSLVSNHNSSISLVLVVMSRMQTIGDGLWCENLIGWTIKDYSTIVIYESLSGSVCVQTTTGWDSGSRQNEKV